jgi:hypothetical protein
MKTLIKKAATAVVVDQHAEVIRTVVLDALASVDTARQKCLIAGHLLNEEKARLPHGDFSDYVAKHIPEISHVTAWTWMRAAANVARALKFEDSIEIEATTIPLSRLLSAPVDELSEAALEYRQQWLDFTADKTIKDCINSVMVDGDPGHRIDRAINGKTKGGTRGEDRKDWPTYIARHISDVTGLLGCNEKNREKRWTDMTPGQREKIQDALSTALVKWPTPLLEHVAKQAREQLKHR